MSYTVEEVAEQVRVHPNTIRNQIKKGLLKSWSPDSKSIRIEPEEVEAWKRRKQNAKPKERRVGGLKALEGGLS